MTDGKRRLVIVAVRGESSGAELVVLHSDDGGPLGRVAGSIPVWEPFRHMVTVGLGRWVALSVESAAEEPEAVA